MHPIFLQIGDFTIRSYGFMAMVGFLVGWSMLSLNRKHAGLTADQASNLVLIGMVSGIIGSRIFYVVLEWKEHFADHPERIIRIDQGGLVFYGGFLLAFALIVGYCRWRKLDVVRVLDIVAPAISAAHACGRIGCYLNGCCYGRITTSILGVVYPLESGIPKGHPGAKVHPIQLYEAAENVLACGLYFYLVRKGKRGMAMSAYMLVYGICRFFNEFFRGDDRGELFHQTLFSPAQWICLGLIPVGAGLLIYFWRKGGNGAKA
jgi:phosphatidylglycerol:prolipoprotein diacylglycerol transferase